MAINIFSCGPMPDWLWDSVCGLLGREGWENPLHPQPRGTGQDHCHGGAKESNRSRVEKGLSPIRKGEEMEEVYPELQFTDGWVPDPEGSEPRMGPGSGGDFGSSPSMASSHSPRLNEPGIKNDRDKLRFDLVPTEAAEAIAEVYTHGARKYNDRNWEKGMSWSRVYAAVQRHLHSFWGGEDIDSESGLSHIALAATSIQFLLQFTLKPEYQNRDDRPKKGPNGNQSQN